ncbi:MAG: DCC1-like thiol-disulfide oxidoreductase family protein [Pseudomonadota bacterium]
MIASKPGPVLLFDGECALCHRVVRRLLRLDRRGVLRFAPLQGRGAQAYLRAHGLPTEVFSTLVFVPDWPGGAAKPLLRTDGVIAALRAAGRPGPARLLAAVPRGLRDAGYAFVARVRHRIFGPWRAEPWPRPEWAARFIE